MRASIGSAFCTLPQIPLTTPAASRSYSRRLEAEMGKHRGVAALLVWLSTVIPCAAQNQGVVVIETADQRVIRGGLLKLDTQAVSVRVNGRETEIPLDSVRRIVQEKRDSVWDGALLCGLWAGVMTLLNGGQGLDEPTSKWTALPAAGMGALLGAGLDSLRHKKTTLFEAPDRRQPPVPRAAVAVTLRF